MYLQVIGKWWKWRKRNEHDLVFSVLRFPVLLLSLYWGRHLFSGRKVVGADSFR